MPIEIERKFLVQDPDWRSLWTCKIEIRDGLVAVAPGRKVRVRVCDERSATLTIKTQGAGFSNQEYEYGIPLADAQELLEQHCLRPVLAKTRYSVPHDPLIWQVDVYQGILDGVVLAEVELSSESQEIVLPPWVGREVTGMPEYKKINMVNARLSTDGRDS